MLLTYVKAENLKYKRSVFRKLILLIPIALILISMIFIFIGIGLGGFSSSIVCNWCMPLASLSIAILSHLVNSKEETHKYRTLYNLPIDLKKIFVSKTLLLEFVLSLIIEISQLL
mgnify:CR=1 FL=1